MATNLVSYVMQFLTPDTIGRIAAALGLGRSDAQTGISAAVQALLAAFSGVASKPGGAQDMVDAVRQQSGMLDSFAGMIGGNGAGQSAFIEKGSSALTSLLGTQDQSLLSGVIGRFAGLGQNASSSLLGILTPVIMGVIGKQIGMGNLNAAGLSGLLASQKDQIAQAMPAGLGKLLGSTGLLDSFSGVAGSAATAAGQAGRAAASAAGQASQYASSTAYSAGVAGQRAVGAATAGVPTWAYWMLPLAIIAGLLLYLFANRDEQVAAQAPAGVPTVVVDGMDIRKQVDDSIGEVRTSLSRITDVTSARAALPRLQVATAQLDRVGNVIERLPEDQRKSVGSVIASAKTTIDQRFDRVLAIPGVAEVSNPTVTRLRTRLADLSAPPATVGER